MATAGRGPLRRGRVPGVLGSARRGREAGVAQPGAAPTFTSRAAVPSCPHVCEAGPVAAAPGAGGQAGSTEDKGGLHGVSVPVSGAAPQPVSPRSPLPGAWCPVALGTCRRLACKTTFSLSRKRKHLVACGAVPWSSKRRQGQGEGRPRLLVTGETRDVRVCKASGGAAGRTVTGVPGAACQRPSRHRAAAA